MSSRDTANVSPPQSYSEFLQTIQPRSRVSFVRFVLVFLGAFVLLQGVYQAITDSSAQRFFIETLTVRPSAAAIQMLRPQAGVVADSHRLVWNGGRLSVLNGCDGVEAMNLLIAAFIAVAGTMHMRLSGIALGVVLIYALNQIRIVALYFAFRSNKQLFELMHGLIGPLAIIALACLFFVWWIGRDAPARAV